MGQSTDGILFYGYCWSEEGDTEEIFGTDDTYDMSEESKKLFGVEISSHCSCDYPIPYIYISETEITASRGYPEKIDMQYPQGQHKWDVQLQEFIDHYKVNMSGDEYRKAPDGPGWFLVSNWC